MDKPVTWSYSAIKLFLQCPHRFYRVKVLKDIVEPEADHLIYGNAAHKAAENYIGNGTALPPQFEFMKPVLDRLNKFPGEKRCEFKMGLTADLEPCDFFAKDVWFRGIIDLLILDGDRARVVDYKTGKSAKYADKDQLELMALAVFKHFPHVKHVAGALVFVVSDEFVKDQYAHDKAPIYWQKWLRDTSRLEASVKNRVWNKTPNFTCRGWCPVRDCEHWEPKRQRK